MKKIIVVAAALVILGLMSGVAMAADTANQNVTIQVNQVAKLKASNTTVTMTVGAPTDGGDDPAVTITNNTNTCGYTSVVATGNTRKLTGATDSDLSAKGMALTLLPAGVPSGCGTAAASAVTLTTAGAELITGIGSCKTGNNNVTLTYGLTISDVTKLTSGSTSVVVTLTLTD